MPNFTDVQFISWEIYTGPNRGPSPWDPDPKKSPGRSYTGLGNAVDNRLDIKGQIVDIEARCSFTFEAIMNAALTTLEGQWGAHTQIWNGANGRSPVPLENQLINANYGQRVNNTTVVKVSNQSDYARDIGIDAYQLWDLGSGYVRVMQPMPL